MALVFFDGFEHYALADITKKWNQYQDTAANSMQTGRLGGSCYRITSAFMATSGYLWKNLPALRTSGVSGVALKFTNCWTTGYPTVLWGVAEGTCGQVMVRLNSTGTLSAYACGSNGVTTNPNLGSNPLTLADGVGADISLGVWFYLEVKWTIHATNGSLEVRINGSPVINLSGVRTTNGWTSNTAKWGTWYMPIQVSYSSETAPYIWQDDAYLLDDQTGLTDFLGDVRVDAHYPNANGTTGQWTRSTGADQYATVDETPVSTTDYNYTSVVGNKDTLNVENFKNPGGTIYAVQTNLWAKKADAGSGSISPVVRTGGVDRDGDSVPLTTEWGDSRQIYEHDPATSTEWVEADFNGAEFGYKKRA